MIQNVERLRAEFEPSGLGERKRFRKARVHSKSAWTIQNVMTGIALVQQSARCSGLNRHGKTALIEPVENGRISHGAFADSSRPILAYESVCIQQVGTGEGRSEGITATFGQ